MQLVKITNPAKRDDANYRTLRLVHQEEVIEIAPGDERIVLFDVAAAFFGNPRAANVGNNRDRVDTFNNLRFMWGYQLGDIEAEAKWAVQSPPFKVLTLEGEYLPMVLDDPDGLIPLPGETASADDIPTNAESKVIREMMAQQQAQITRLEQMLADREVAANPGNVPVAPDDAPKLAGQDGDTVTIAGVGGEDTSILPPAPVNEGAPTQDAPRSPGGKSKH